MLIGAVLAAAVVAATVGALLATVGGRTATPPATTVPPSMSEGTTTTQVPATGHPSSLPGSSPSSPSSSSSSTPGSSAPGTTRLPKVPHVMVILLENHGYSSIIGSPTAPYLNRLADRYGLATASYATTHPSLPNYLELVSGSTQRIAVDCTTTCTANGRQVVDQLRAKGIRWRAYMEGAPGACYTGSGAYPYDRHHDPFVYAPHIVQNRSMCDAIVPFSALRPELARGSVPPFVWVTPDVEHDMHTGSVRQGDAWLSQQLPVILRSSWYRAGGIVVITFDESGGTTGSGCCSGAAGGHVATLVVSARTPRGARLATPLDGAGILRTIEALYGLPYLGAAGDPRSGTLLPLLGKPRAR